MYKKILNRAAWYCCIASFLYTPHVLAQAVTKALITKTEPQVYRDGPDITGCGMRVVVIGGGPVENAYMGDFSLTVRFSKSPQALWSLGKGGMGRGNVVNENVPFNWVPIKSFFIGTPDGRTSYVANNFTASSSPNYLLGGRPDVGDAIAILEMIVEGTALQYGVSSSRDEATPVFSFASKSNDEDRKTFYQCLEGFSTAAQRALSDEGD